MTGIPRLFFLPLIPPVAIQGGKKSKSKDNLAVLIDLTLLGVANVKPPKAIQAKTKMIQVVMRYLELGLHKYWNL